MASRLQKQLTKKTKRNFILSVIGIVFILFLLVNYGIPAIANVGFLLAGKDEEASVTKNKEFIASPILDSMPSATNSGRIIVSGKAIKDVEIEIYVNDEKEETVSPESDGSFKTRAPIEKGTNTIKARAVKDSNKSDFSDSQTVNYVTSAPELTIDSPTDGSNYSGDNRTITVSGKVDQTGTVTVNDQWAILDGNNNFSSRVTLKDGENQIKVVAINEAGNKTEKTVKATYSP